MALEQGGLGFFWEGPYIPAWFLRNSLLAQPCLGLMHIPGPHKSEPYTICEGHLHPPSHQGWKFPNYLGFLSLPHFPHLVTKPILLEVTPEPIPSSPSPAGAG